MIYIMNYLFVSLVATAVMTTFLWKLIPYCGYHVNLVKVLGAYVTKDDKNAFIPGLIIHLLAGVSFCSIYFMLFYMISMTVKISLIYVMLGGFVGFAHGIVVALMLVHVISDNHPIKKYKRASFGVASFYFLAHIMYGLTVGVLFAALLTKNGIPLPVPFLVK